MKITERRLRSIIRSVIKESPYSDDLSGGHGHMGSDPVQALGPRPSEKDELLYGKNGYKEQINNCYIGDRNNLLYNIGMIRKNFSGKFKQLNVSDIEIMSIEIETFEENM